jgi:hypothetical protein
MKQTVLIVFLLVLYSFQSFAQEAWETHTRGLLHQSVFNTGALGVQWESFRTANSGDSLRTPFEWPGNSHFISDNRDYWYYNSCGGGLAMLCDTGRTGNRSRYLILDTVISSTARYVDMIGCLGFGSIGMYRDGTGIYYWPGTVTKTTNYPLNSDGSWNSGYNPNEAEEIITSSVKTPYGITMTRISRAWSYPGYDSFIIYDYKFENTGDYFKGIPNNTPDTLSEIAISWIESFLPSYAYMNMQKNDFTTGASNQLGHFDLKRYMQYVHSADGRPHLTNYADWSDQGLNGGGLMAPAAVGYMMLYFDYDHLMTNATSRFVNAVKTTVNEQNYVYDANNKFKQPWVVGTISTGLASPFGSHLNISDSRYYVWNPENPAAGDALINQWLTPADSSYWWGRGRPNNNYNYASPKTRSFVLGPYQLAPHESFHVVVAELAGFGPGRKSDVRFRDYGGGNETTIGDQIDNNFHPVASWDSVITYANAPTSISSTGGIGINYIPMFGLPGYIRDTNVVSIRDVADRCIQMYSGNSSVIKYDTSQYEPWGNTSASRHAPSPSVVAARAGGWNAAFKIPLPAPVIRMDTNSTLVWNGTVDSLNNIIKPYVNSELAYYEILRSTSTLGPWIRLDTIGRRDIRYWNHSLAQYEFVDHTGTYGTEYYYCVVSVDTLGRKSGLTNMIKATYNHIDNTPITHFQLYQNYPNPFNPKTRITFLIAKRGKVSLIVYDLLGREVSTLVDEVKEVGSYSVILNDAKLSSGVYFYRLSSGSFVQTKKMLMIK